MAMESFGGVTFSQAWHGQEARDLPSGQEPMLLCRTGQPPVLALERAPLRIDAQHGLDLGETPFLRQVGNQVELRAPGGLSIQIGSRPAPALTVSADGSVTIGTSAHAAKLEVNGELRAQRLAVGGDVRGDSDATFRGSVQVGKDLTISGQLNIAGRIRRNGMSFSTVGVAKHGDPIPVPWGTTDEWAVFVAFREVGYGEQDRADWELDNALICYECRAEAMADKKAWSVVARYRFKYGPKPEHVYWSNDAPSSLPDSPTPLRPATVNYALFPR